MDASDWIALAALIVAVLALAAAAGTMVYTRVQAKATKDSAASSRISAKASEASAEAAKMSAGANVELTAIEASRRHTELTPEFELGLTEGYQGSRTMVSLRSAWSGRLGWTTSTGWSSRSRTKLGSSAGAEACQRA